MQSPLPKELVDGKSLFIWLRNAQNPTPTRPVAAALTLVVTAQNQLLRCGGRYRCVLRRLGF